MEKYTREDLEKTGRDRLIDIIIEIQAEEELRIEDERYRP